MPTIEVNSARLRYEVYGPLETGAVPILLIHGATATGQADWAPVIPLLSSRHTVIVPDCRGHGQSTNPALSYSFREMAGDAAALIQALGYERAHVIGHSNGGNVALVTLFEHSGVVQTCILQAANAYVSPDLLVREPAIFDPDRVARESTAWMHEMIALHGATHGLDYWRELLRLTLAEILSQPNYTAGDLGRVTRPVLVIQGGKDPVNAPSRHAQFIAKHISHAELWIPAGIGHNVHKDLTCDWVGRVLDFLDRRGDDAGEALYRLQQDRYADRRESIFELHVEEGSARLSGRVLTAEQHAAALDALPIRPVEDRVSVLLHEATPWALVNHSVTDMRREPRRLAERVSQALLGEAVRILEVGEDWHYVRLEHDGYMGWVQASALHCCGKEESLGYRAAANMLVTGELAQAYAGPPTAVGFAGTGKLPFGVTLPRAGGEEGHIALRLPDGHLWWAAEGDLVPVSRRPRPDAGGIAATLDLVRRSAGVPYLWGGRSPFGYDCSGLAQAFWAVMGVTIPRDADQQYRHGAPVEGDPAPGDLLFFGESEDYTASGAARHARISHVAISLGGSELIHANGSAGGISYNSFDPHSPLYRAWLYEHFAGARRYTTNHG